jgi:hypothetical protein
MQQILIAALLSLALGAGGAWEYQEHAYGERIAQRQAEQSDALSKRDGQIIIEDAKNAKLSQQLNLAAQQRAAQLATHTSNVASVVHSRGLWVRASCQRVNAMPNATASASIAPDGTSGVRLPDGLADHLRTRAASADADAVDLQDAHAYALILNDWIDSHDPSTRSATQ